MEHPLITESLYRRYMDGLMAGERTACADIVRDLLARDIGLYDLYIHLFQRSLYEIGELWEANRISVAVEHLATTITEGLLTLVYPRIFAAEHIGRKAVVSCVANEYHQIGGKMAADVCELNGWDGYFLGANTPTEDLVRFIDQKRPDLLGLSLALDLNFDNLRRVVERVRGAFRNLPIVVGGQAFRRGGSEVIAAYPGVSYIPTLTEFEAILKAS